MKTCYCIFAVGLFASSLPAVSATDTSNAIALEPFATDSVWLADYSAALKKASAENKIVLLNFTGSDWCIWCHRLHDEVLVQKPFVDYAREHLVLLEVDFPLHKPQPADEVRQNQTLSDRFKVTGYPTVILVDATGRELGRTGYMQGGAKTFVRELKHFSVKAAPRNGGVSPPAHSSST